MADLILRNKTSEEKVWGGQIIEPDGQYTLQEGDLTRLYGSASFMSDLSSHYAAFFDGTSELYNLSTREKSYQVASYDLTFRLDSDAWYDTDTTGIYSGLAEDSTYSYSGNNLISKTVKTYYYEGAVKSAQIYEYYNDGQRIIEKIRSI